ncbi:MAG: PspA/IM30 family protein [Bacteroidia bacterium]
METQIFPSPDKQQLKAYWNRPGGKFGIIFGIALTCIIAYYLLPVLNTIVWNTLNFGIALACLGIFLYAITHRTFRLSLYYFYEMLMKKLVGIVIELDPFIIAEDYINDMEEQREKLYKQSIEVDAQKEKIEAKIREKQTEINKLMFKAQTAKEKDMMPELGNATRQIGRLDEYIKQLSPIRNNLFRIGDYLTKIHKNSAYLIEDARNELELKKDLYKSVSSGNRALNSALKIFKGDPEKKLLVEQSMEFLKEDIALKLANMKKAISYSADFMRSIDLDNATYEKEGLNLLENFSTDDQFSKLDSTANKSNHEEKFSTDTYNDLIK